MNKAPAGGIDSQLVVRKQPEAPQLDIGPTREGVRDALKDESLMARHPDAQTLARVLDAPAVVSGHTMKLVGLVAAGAALPGCDGSTILCVTAGTLIPLALGGLGAKAAYDAFFTTRTLEAGQVGVFRRKGFIGNMAVKLGKPTFEAYEGRPVTHFIDQEYEGGFQNRIMNFPPPKKEAGGSVDADYHRGLKSTGQVIHDFAWSVTIDKVPISEQNWGDVEKFYRNFYKGKTDEEQSALVFDATQKALNEVIASLTFKDVHDAESKRDAINTAVQNHKKLKEFKDKFGVELVFVLGEINAPKSLSDVAEERLVLEEKVKMGEDKVKVATKEGEAIQAKARGEAEQIRLVEDARTEALAKRVKDLGIPDSDKAKVVMADAATRTADVLGSQVANMVTGWLEKSKKS